MFDYEFDNADAMRAQTQAYVMAVYEAHPELMPPEQRPASFDPYPKSGHLAAEIAGLMMAKQEQAERESEITELCNALEQLNLNEGPDKAHKIARAVAKAHRVPWKEFTSRRRNLAYAAARQHAMWEIHKHTKLTLPEIGRIFDRDHSTVLFGIRRHQARLSNATGGA